MGSQVRTTQWPYLSGNRQGNTPNSFYENCIILMSKMNNKSTREENYRPVREHRCKIPK